MPVPYSEHVGSEDPVALMARTLEDYRAALSRASAAFWQTPWQPGKWTFREIMIHVAQWEAIFGYRLTCAVSMPDFEIQAVDQDPLLTHTAAIDGPAALAGFEGARRMNLGLVRSLSPADRATQVRHPHYGMVSVQDLIVQLTGHAIHHLKQMPSSASSGAAR
jgi:hypothetical protein